MIVNYSDLPLLRPASTIVNGVRYVSFNQEATCIGQFLYNYRNFLRVANVSIYQVGGVRGRKQRRQDRLP